MPKGRVPAREVICRACHQPFVSDRVGKAAFFCHTQECDEERERERKAERAAEVEANAVRRRREAAERRAERERQRAEEREERERQRKAARIAERRRKALERKARKRGLEIFAPIMDDPDQKLMLLDILEIVQLASEVEDPTWLELRKAITRCAIARPQGREASHIALQHLSAVAMKMADLLRTHATRDPTSMDEDEESADEPELVAA